MISDCLRQTMNSWFSHGQHVIFDMAPEVCCSLCMKKCMCVRCSEQLLYFEPCRIPKNIAKSTAVKGLAQFLSSLTVNDQTSDATPPYEPNNLAEVLVGNVMEFEDMGVFKDFLAVFSLGDVNYKLVRSYVELQFDKIVASKTEPKSETEMVESADILDSCTDSDDESSTAEDLSDYFDNTDSD